MSIHRFIIYVKYVIIFTFSQLFCFSQTEKKFSLTDSDISKDNIVMTWNATTPESEMKDDIKALSEKGITIKYANIKRNSKDEITAIKVEYSDRKGNSGAMELNNQKPINTITFFKQNDEVGFGEPSSSNGMLASNDFFNNFSNGQDIMKQFNFGNSGGESRSFQFSFPNGDNFGKSSSKIIIQKDGKKPLVIEDGEVIEGGDDYTKEEIEEIKKNNKTEFSNGIVQQSSDLRNEDDRDNFKKEMEKMQLDLEKITPNSDAASQDFDKTKAEVLKAKEEMLKAKEELENAKKELEKAKSTLKIKKA